MALIRWIDKEKLKRFDKISIPVTDAHAGTGSPDDERDFQMTGAELVEVVNENLNKLLTWGLEADVLPTCHSFSDPEYLKAGSWFFEDISNTEQKPDKLAGKKVQFARLLCEAGRSETEGLNFVKQYLLYINMTDNELELSMRGVLMNGGGEVQGATPWKVGTDLADTAKEAEHAASADEATHATNADNATNATNADEATHALNADEATHAASADMAKNAGTAANAHNAANATLSETLKAGATMGGLEVITTKYASKIQGRNLVTVLKASSARDAFDKLRALNGNYDGLMLGDYIDIPQLNVNGIGTLNNDYNNLRVEIAGFDHYYKVGDTETGRGILFTFRNCAFRHGMNTSNVNADGYNGANLKKILNGDFANALEAAIGAIKTVHRLVDTHGNWTWTGEKCWLPSEVETIGHQAWGRGGYYTGTSVQYPIYALAPDHRLKNSNGARYWYWTGTSDSGSSTYFCVVSHYGRAYYHSASNGSGVSPAFYL